MKSYTDSEKPLPTLIKEREPHLHAYMQLLLLTVQVPARLWQDTGGVDGEP